MESKSELGPGVEFVVLPGGSGQQAIKCPMSVGENSDVGCIHSQFIREICVMRKEEEEGELALYEEKEKGFPRTCSAGTQRLCYLRVELRARRRPNRTDWSVFT